LLFYPKDLHRNNKNKKRALSSIGISIPKRRQHLE